MCSQLNGSVEIPRLAPGCISVTTHFPSISFLSIAIISSVFFTSVTVCLIEGDRGPEPSPNLKHLIQIIRPFFSISVAMGSYTLQRSGSPGAGLNSPTLTQRWGTSATHFSSILCLIQDLLHLIFLFQLYFNSELTKVFYTKFVVCFMCCIPAPLVLSLVWL